MSRPILTNPNFFSSGCYMLDLVLGGGWAKNRIVNIVGDESTGKSLLAIEACANFILAGNEISDIRYVETEYAFDESFAQSVGLPENLSVTQGIHTVEELHEDLNKFLLARKGKGRQCLYIVDSLDALSDAAELDRDFGEGTYGTAKAKLISELFRREAQDLSQYGATLMIVSQVRDAIGVMFGEKKKRSGGRALSFYASQVLWLSEKGKIEWTVRGNKRPVGIEVRARIKKNKMGVPFRECEMILMFGYGVDDELSMLNWLDEQKDKLDLPGGSAKECIKLLEKWRADGNIDALQELSTTLRGIARTRWYEIEEALKPPLRKYR